MEFDNFLTEPKWQILELIATAPTSPVKISEKIGTSVAYVSQQLKLLEAAGIIKKERTKATGKGKPRLIYSISEDVFHITALVKETPIKKKITPTKQQKIVLRIWALENQRLSYLSEKLFWRIEPFLENIDSIFADTEKSKIIITSKRKELAPILQSFLKEINNEISSTLNEKYDPNLLYPIYTTPKKDIEEGKA
jgi:predicted transcriptional regulator